MLLGVPKDRNSFIVGLEDKGVTIPRNIGDQSKKCNFSEELDFQKCHCKNIKFPNLEVNKIISQIYVSIQV
jgi:hypothetical protein